MSSEWHKKVRLSDCASFQEGYVNPSQLDNSYFGEDVKWLRATDLNDGFVYETSRRLSQKGFESAGKSATLFEPNTLAISKSGTIGRIGILKDYMCGNRAVINIKPNETCDSRFIFYTLLLNRQTIETLAEGSVQKNLYVSALGSLVIELPSLKEQKKVTSVLGALDDRIALLRETNTTLEAIAQALFKSWFVDFDPVRAKAEGRARQDGERSGQPRMPQVSDLPRPGAEAGAEAQGQPEGMGAPTAALFPDSFEESELGLVPKGWAIGQLQDLLVLQRGFDLPASARTEGEYPLIAASGPSGTHHIAMAKGPGVITGRSGVLGKVFLTLEDYWPLNTTLWVKEFKRATPCFAFQLLKLLDFGSFNAGSAVPSLNRNHIHSLKYVLPPAKLVAAYEDAALLIYERVLENNRQAQTLTQLRDTLLPRLISGQLRLPDAEHAVEEALA